MSTVVESKRCSRCGIARPIGDFGSNRRNRDGLQSWCSPCRAEDYLCVKATPERLAAVQASRRATYERHKAAVQGRTRQRRQEEPDAHRAAAQDLRMRYRYGITAEQYESMCVEQDDRCPLCGETVTKLHIDHDHQTGRVRGLLCGPCNRALGFVDRPEWLARALAYLVAKGTNDD